MIQLRQLFKPVKSMSTEKAKTFINEHQEGSFTLLDVRQPSEYEKEHIPGAKLIPLPELKDRISELDEFLGSALDEAPAEDVDAAALMKAIRQMKALRDLYVRGFHLPALLLNSVFGMKNAHHGFVAALIRSARAWAETGGRDNYNELQKGVLRHLVTAAGNRHRGLPRQSVMPALARIVEMDERNGIGRFP